MYRLEDTHWWYVGMWAITSALLQSAAAGRPDHQWHDVLDAGCGTGGAICRLPEGCRAVGVDLAPEALELCQKRGLQRVSGASVEHLPFADESFDLLLSSDVIYHLGVAHDREALREFNRVLRPGGVAVVRVPAYDWLRGAHDEAVHTRHRYTRGELRDKLAAAGFEVVRITYANSLLFPLALAKRLLEGRLTSSTSELESPSRPLHWLGTAALGLEARLLGAFDLPWGLSVIGVGRKREPQPAAGTTTVRP
jgi:SAM-dependent methyltransferase